MGLIQQIKDVATRNRRQRASEITQEFRNALYSSPLCSDYENVFAQVRPLIDAMVSVRPFGVEQNGARLDPSRTPELNVLMEPNETMGAIEFMDTMFATWLTEDALYIHVHKKGNAIKGYTLLPPDSKIYLGNGKYYWQVYGADGTVQTLYDDEVMELHYSRNPRDLKGVSPAGAVRVFAQIDDLLAQFEKAYLENGAIPASVTIIRASTPQKFNETRQDLERQLKGASNKGKTLYLWRQFNNDDGTERDQVEVKTIQGNNNTLAIKELATIVSDRLNKAYGVSNFILGDDSSAKYDNAELSDYQFTRRRVKPALIKFWSQFQHELDRITGGLGYAINFHLDMPELTERRKVEAETAEKTTQNLIRLIEAGARPSEACKSLDLDVDKWLNTAVGIYSRVLATIQAERALAVTPSTESKQKSTESQSTHSQDKNTSHTCQHHHHEHSDDYYQPFSDEEKVEKQIFDKLMAIALAIFEEDPTLDLEQIQNEIFDLIEEEANRGGKEALEMIAQLVDEETEAGIKEIIKNGGANISEELGRRLHERSNLIVKNYADHARSVMRSVLETTEPLTANEIKEKLMQVIPEGRAATIARNETVYAFKSGSLELDQRIAERYDLKLELTWHARKDSKTCDICAAMDGQKTMLGQKYADQVRLALGTKLMNGRIVGEAPEGATEEEKKLYTGTDVFAWTQDKWNDDGTIPNAHVNCVLGDTIVKADGVKLATRMNYSGDIVELKTRGGKKLAVTPNHILLTDRGWVAAKNIKKTDKVITYSDSVERAMTNDTIDGKNPAIADEFVALSKTPGVVTIEVPVTAEDFKGDGIANEKVEVILAESLLRNKRDAASIKLGGKLPFVGGKFTDGTLFGLGSIDQLLVGVLLATNGIVGSTGKALTFLGSEGGHPEISRLTSATAYNARLNEAAANSSTVDVEAFSKSFLAEAGLIEFDDVIDIKIYSVHNTPVYDVETTSTLYTANGIISSNCRCFYTARVITEGE